MGVDDHQYSEKGFFHNVGIDYEDTYAMRGKWRMQKLTSIMKELGHEEVCTDVVTLLFLRQ